MKKWLSLLLLCSFLLPFVSQGAHAIDRFDYENVAQKDYEEDICYFEETEGNITCSSGGIDRWQTITKATGTTKKSTKDPKNESNKVFIFQGLTESYLTKGLFWANKLETTHNVVFSFDFYLPSHSHAEGETPATKNQSVEFTHAGESYAEFIYDEAYTAYTYTMLDRTGTAPADTWMHISFCFTPNEDGTNELSIQLSGEGVGEKSYDIAEKTVDYRGMNLGARANLFYMNIVPEANAQAAIYVDNTKLYRMFDFAPATVTPTYYAEDGFANFDLQGKITLTLHHELDLSTVDLLAK